MTTQPNPLVTMSLHNVADVLQRLADGLNNMPNVPMALDHETTEAVDLVTTLVETLEILRSINVETLTDPEVLDRWQEAMDAGSDAQEALAAIVTDWEEELSELNDAASEVLGEDDEEDDEDYEDDDEHEEEEDE